MDRQMDGQAKNNRPPPTRWRGPKYILGHTDVLINDKRVFCECQYLNILRQKITITLTFIKTLGYRTTLKGVINFQVEFGVLWNDTCMLTLKNGQIKFRGEITLILMIIK